MPEINDQTKVRAIYEGATRNPKFQSCVDLVETTAGEHSLPPTEIDTRVKMLIHLLRLAQHSGVEPGRLGELKGKTVLDLACGRQVNDVTMQPWFCRLAHKLGCDVTGVDLPLEPELAALGLDDEVRAPLEIYRNGSHPTLRALPFWGFQCRHCSFHLFHVKQRSWKRRLPSFSWKSGRWPTKTRASVRRNCLANAKNRETWRSYYFKRQFIQ